MQGFLLVLDERYPDWSLIFISECDKTLSSDFRMHSEGGHRIFRHWPGPGSLPMCFIVHKNIVPLCKQCFWHGRAGGVHVSSFSCSSMMHKTGVNLVVTGFHGAHGDLLPVSLSDCSTVLHHFRSNLARKARILVYGDTNVDYLPTLAIDPWIDDHGRHLHHLDRRIIFEDWLDTLSLHLQLPERMVSGPGGPWSDACAFSVVSRVPLGEQLGVPSLLDFGVASDRLVRESFVDWHSADADHAYVVYILNSVHSSVVRRKKIWKCVDEHSCLEKVSFADFEKHDSVSAVMSKLTAIQDSCDSGLSCAARRRERMPFELRECYRRAVSAASACDKRMWQLRARRRRKQWVIDLRLQSRLARVGGGRVLSKTKKLFSIKSVNLGSSITLDQETAADHLAQQFSAKWGCDDAALRQDLQDILSSWARCDLLFEVEEVASAFKGIRHKFKRDASGCSLRMLELFFISQPAFFIQWLARVASDSVAMSDLVVNAAAYGKESAHVSADTVRVIAPLPVVMQVLDVIIAGRLGGFLDSVFLPLQDVWEGAQPRTQVLDIAAGLSALIEKDLDLESAAAISQCDVRQHYDSIRILKITRWLVDNGCGPEIAIAALRHQLLPRLMLRVGAAASPVVNRTIGGLTGSRVAGQLGRVPVQTSLRVALPFLRLHAFHVSTVRLTAASYVDNLYFAGKGTWSACKMGDEFIRVLARDWSQEVKTSSCEVMPTFANPDVEVTDPRWIVKECMVVLGHLVDSSGDFSADFDALVRKLWKSFWTNAGLLTRKRCALHYRLALIKRATDPHILWHCVRWPFSIAKAERLDQVQRKMLSICLRTPPRSDDDAAQFFRRRARAAAALQRKLGRWSCRWAKQVLSWHAHLGRPLNQRTWAAQLMSVRAPAELAWRRALWGRPRSRRLPGFCCRRWFESVPYAQNFLFDHDSQ